MKYGFIGTGNMGGALATACAKAVEPESILLSNRSPEKARALAEKLGVPLEEIRKMQSGTHTVGDGMRRHLVTLERDKKNLEQARFAIQK